MEPSLSPLDSAPPDSLTPLARLVRSLDPRVRAALVAQLRSPRTWVFGGILCAVAVILAMLPLFGALGFEFAFVMAAAAGIASADLGAALTRRTRAMAQAGSGPVRLVASLAAAASLLAFLSTLAPLGIVALNSTRVRTCDWLFGFECYGALTVLSAMWGAALGVLCGLAAGRRRVLSNALPYLVILALVLHSLWRFYAAPPVFSYNPLVGYFPGNLYDEEIRLGAPLVWSRLHQFALLAGLLGLAAALVDARSGELRLLRRWPSGVRWGTLFGCAAALGVALVLRAHGGGLGFAVDSEGLAEQLNGHIETEHFVIHYPRGGEIERDIAHIAADHEFRLAQVLRALGVPAPRQRIASFYFEDTEQKARFIGARKVQMAKPWRHEIYLQHAPFPHQVLRHEIAHAVAGEFGDPIFGVSAGRVLGVPVFFNAGLIEGIAVAADWPDHFTRALTPHQSAKAMTDMGMVPPLERLLSTGFFQFSSARSYTAAGSFVRFLLDRYGATRLRELYRSGGDFAGAYGRHRDELVREWRQMVASIELPATSREKVRERFRRGGIFERPCPHAVADKLGELSRLVRRGELEEAIDVARVLCDDVPDEPSHRMDLGELLFRNDEHDGARAIYRHMVDEKAGLSTTIRAEAYLSLAELAASADDRAGVAQALDRAAELPIDDDQARQVVARSIANAHTGPAGPALRRYFWPPDPNAPADPVAHLGLASAAAVAEPQLALAHYLVGRNLGGRGVAAEAATALRRAMDLGLGHPLLVREGAQLMAAQAYLSGDLATVERAAAILTASDQPDVTQLFGFDWLERVHWKRHGRLPPRPLGPATTPPAIQAAAPRR